jgi:hypothetical protein
VLNEAEPTIPPLGDGEERLLQTVHRPDGNRNDIYLVRRRPSDDEAMGTGDPVNFVAIIRSTDRDPNDASPPWAWQRGPDERTIYIRLAEAFVNAPPPPGGSATLDTNVQWFVDRIREQHPGPSPMELLQIQAFSYAEVCRDVLEAANACLEHANTAIGARAKIAQHQNDGLPGTPIAIRNFTSWAESAEQELAERYQAFEAACATARDTADQLIAASRDPHQAEMVLALHSDEPTLDTIATVKSILRATYGPTPVAFIHGVQESNALMEASASEDGNIYTPLTSA